LRIGGRPFAASTVAAARRSAVGTHLIGAAMALPRLLLAVAAVVAPAHLLVHSVLRSGDALPMARQLVPSLLQLGRAGAVLVDHFGRSAREESRILQALRDPGELPFQLLQLLLHA